MASTTPGLPLIFPLYEDVYPPIWTEWTQSLANVIKTIHLEMDSNPRRVALATSFLTTTTAGQTFYKIFKTMRTDAHAMFKYFIFM